MQRNLVTVGGLCPIPSAHESRHHSPAHTRVVTPALRATKERDARDSPRNRKDTVPAALTDRECGLACAIWTSLISAASTYFIVFDASKDLRNRFQLMIGKIVKMPRPFQNGNTDDWCLV